MCVSFSQLTFLSVCHVFIYVMSVSSFICLTDTSARLPCFNLLHAKYHKRMSKSVFRSSCREAGIRICLHDDFFCLIFCLFVLCCDCVCVCVCTCVSSSFRATGVSQSMALCVTSQRVYSQRLKWTRYFPLLMVLISVCQQETQPLLHSLTALSYLNRKLKAGSLAHPNL